MTDTLKLEDLAPERMMVELPTGEKTPMLDPRELSLHDRAKVGQMAKAIMDLNQKTIDGRVGEEDAAALEEALRDFTSMVLPDASEQFITSMAPFHLDQVTGAFLGRFGDMTMKVAETMEGQMPNRTPGS